MAFAPRNNPRNDARPLSRSSNLADAFKGMNNEFGGRGGLFFEPGNYIVQIGRCKLNDGFKGRAFIAETTVLESDCEKLPPGSKPSFVVNLDKIPKLALGNVGDFVRAAIASLMDRDGEERPSDLDAVEGAEESMADVIGEANILSGAILAVEAFHKEKQNSEGVFTRLIWSVPEDVAERYRG